MRSDNSGSPDGVIQLLQDAPGRSSFYLNLTLDDPTTDPRFSFDNINKGVKVTKKTENGITYYSTPGSKVSYGGGGKDGMTIRIGSYASGGKGKTQTHKWSDTPKPTFLYNDKDIMSSEITVYIRNSGPLGNDIHKTCSFKIHGAPPDATRSLFETVFPTDSSAAVEANWNYKHTPYVKVPKIKQYIKTFLKDGKWVGLKHIHIISSDRTKANNYLYVDLDPFDATGKPKNNFHLMAEWDDDGAPNAYKKISSTWGAQVNKVRMDGFSEFDFTLFSDREIVPAALPGADEAILQVARDPNYNGDDWESKEETES